MSVNRPVIAKVVKTASTASGVDKAAANQLDADVCTNTKLVYVDYVGAWES